MPTVKRVTRTGWNFLTFVNTAGEKSVYFLQSYKLNFKQCNINLLWASSYFLKKFNRVVGMGLSEHSVISQVFGQTHTQIHTCVHTHAPLFSLKAVALGVK